MKQFDILYWKPPGWQEPHPVVVVSHPERKPPGWQEPHPVVVVSHPERADRKKDIEVLACSTQRTQRYPEPHEILLDEADGLDWPTLCKCDMIYAAARTELTQHKGHVIDARQGPLVRTMIAAHGWGAVL